MSVPDLDVNALLNEYFSRCTQYLAENVRLTVLLNTAVEEKNRAWARVEELENGPIDGEREESETVRIGQGPRVWPREK